MTKSKLTILFALLMSMVASVALAQTVEIGGIYYNLDSGGTAEVTTWQWSDEYSAYSGEIIIPESITYNETTYSVTSIHDETFYRCTGLTSVEIPSSVTSISYAAFSGCSGLTSINIR